MNTLKHLAVRGSDILVATDSINPDQTVPVDCWLHPVLPAEFLALAEDHCPLSLAVTPSRYVVHSFSVDQLSPANCSWLPLRDLVYRLPEESWLPAARAMAYANWHRGNRFCARCGAAMADAAQTAAAGTAAAATVWLSGSPGAAAEAPTALPTPPSAVSPGSGSGSSVEAAAVPKAAPFASAALAAAEPGELALRCTGCGQLLFPRISPAILAVVVKDGKLLLARNAANKQGFWSLVAGFMEPGERFEDCVRREVREEVGIEVQVDGYLGSQPWPFPDQLMVGFSASWVSGELKPDGIEIAEALWFAPDQLPPVPRSGSLSRRLIDQACKKLSAS
ncbi:MAG: NAD(+) diphosphatase [Spirochaetes bacterium]|nr:NAD(+) diphosphatase [Spirochaetota bacterium]